MPGEFADSNVLLYVTSPDPDKARIARAVIARYPTVSVQVLNEFVNVARRKFKREWLEIVDLLDELRPFVDVHPLTEAMHRTALRLAARYRLSWWDALIASAALTLGCDTLLSEDMHAGLVIDDRLTIRNPFA